MSNNVALPDPIGAVLYACELNDRSKLYGVSCSISMLSSYSRRAQIRCAFLSVCFYHRTYADTRATPGFSKAETKSPHAPPRRWRWRALRSRPISAGRRDVRGGRTAVRAGPINRTHDTV